MAKIKNLKSSSQNVMVIGPRGSGKTTLVLKALHGKSGVVHVQLEPCSRDAFYSEILDTILTAWTVLRLNVEAITIEQALLAKSTS